MKQIFIAIMAILGACTVTNAQTKSWPKNEFADSNRTNITLKKESRFFVNLHVGYSFALGSTFKFYPDDVHSISVRQIENNPETKSTSYRAPTKGLGQGLRFGAGMSYILNDFVNIGVDLDYFRSTISKTRDSSYYRLDSNNPQNELYYDESLRTSYDATLLTIAPNVMLKAISRPNFFVYTKVGLVFTFRPNSLQKEVKQGNYQMGWQGFFRDSMTTTEKTYEWGIKNPSVGFMGGIGSQVRISERFRLFGELQFSHLVFVVRERSLTSFKADGVETISTVPLSERELMFEKNLQDNESVQAPEKPSRTIIQRIPITYIGVQTGIVYRF